MAIIHCYVSSPEGIMLFAYDLGQPQSLNPKPRAKHSSLIELFHT